MNTDIQQTHPAANLVNTQVLPSVWCPGCGIGTTVAAFIEGFRESHLDQSKIHIASGIGCTDRITDYLKFRSFRIPKGNIINYSTRLSVENPILKLVLFLNNADLLCCEVDDFLEIAKHETNLLIIHINNMVNIKTVNSAYVNTPFVRRAARRGVELPFNMPHLAKLAGANYIARWTPLRAGWFTFAVAETLDSTGFSFIEMISPCCLYDSEDGMLGDSVDKIIFFDQMSMVRQYEPTINLDLRAQKEVIIGKFVDRR